MKNAFCKLNVINKKPLRIFTSFLLIIIVCLTMGACTEPEDKNEASLRALLEYEFNAPNMEYSRVYDEVLSEIERDSDGEPSAEQDWSKLSDYHEKTYGPYLTESYYLQHVYAFAHQYHNFDFDYKIIVDSIDVKQDEKRTKDYDFTVHVSYEVNGEDMGKAEITGMAVFHDEGEIARIRYFSDDGLYEKLRTSK